MVQTVHSVRSYWSVENGLRWMMVFCEDECRIRSEDVEVAPVKWTV